MKLLITGGAGFIGSHLVEGLIEDNEIVVIDNFNGTYNPKIKRNNIKEISLLKQIRIYEVDIRNIKKVEEVFQKEKGFDLCIHLAAATSVGPSMKNPKYYYEENVIGTLNIIETMKKYGCKKMIYFSSSSVYGNTKREKFLENDSADKPLSIYAATKRASEIMLYNYYINYNFSILIIRPFNIYGRRQRPDLALSIFTKAILNNEEITIFGDGNMLRDYTHVSDVLNAVRKSLNYMAKNSHIYEIINVASSNPKTVNELIESIKEVTNYPVKIINKEKRIGDVEKTYGDISKAKELLNWTPKINFKYGINDYIKWYRENEK